MDKLQYLIKTLSRTRRKDYENYVVNAVWNRLGDDSIQPVSQQYIGKPDGGGYFIDLYFPQLNMGIECDEAFHLQTNAHDKEREVELIDILRRIEPDSGYEAIHIDVSQGYAQTERQIQNAVVLLTRKICELRDSSRLSEWDIGVKPAEFFSSRESIDVDDDIGFDTIIETCNVLFDTHYEHHQQRGYFMPRGPFRERFNGRYHPWFPKLSVDGSNAHGWVNLVSLDGTEVYEGNVEGIDELSGSEGFERVVFAKAWDPVLRTDEYRFLGVFQLDGFKTIDDKRYRRYRRTATEFPILRRMSTIEPDERMREQVSGIVELLDRGNRRDEHELIERVLELCERSKWEMDCGHAFGAAYDRASYDADELAKVIGNVRELGLLGSGIYSQWRYLTHWQSGYESFFDEEHLPWFQIAFKHLQELLR